MTPTALIEDVLGSSDGMPHVGAMHHPVGLVTHHDTMLLLYSCERGSARFKACPPDGVQSVTSPGLCGESHRKERFSSLVTRHLLSERGEAIKIGSNARQTSPQSFQFLQYKLTIAHITLMVYLPFTLPSSPQFQAITMGCLKRSDRRCPKKPTS